MLHNISLPTTVAADIQTVIAKQDLLIFAEIPKISLREYSQGKTNGGSGANQDTH